jgi:hypothetical protein
LSLVAFTAAIQATLSQESRSRATYPLRPDEGQAALRNDLNAILSKNPKIAKNTKNAFRA